jgi:hypothetical protein
MLTIRVGKQSDHKDFVAHESFLTSRSDFFRRAMNGSWAESESRVVKLPEDDPKVFAIYVSLIYTGQLTTMLKSKEELATLDTATFRAIVQAEYATLLQMYILGDKLQDLQAKNATVAAVLELIDMKSAENRWFVPMVELVNMSYERTPAGSPIRRLMTDLWSSNSVREILQNASKMHEDFRIDLAKCLSEIRPKKQGEGGNRAKRNGMEAYLEKPEGNSSATPA